jgi:hypothetical protein
MHWGIGTNKANLSCRTDGVHGTPYEAVENALRETKPISEAGPLPGEEVPCETKPICACGFVVCP